MKEYLKKVFSGSDEASSKRFFGAIGFICSILFISIWKHDLISELLYVSSALLGLGILDRWIKK